MTRIPHYLLWIALAATIGLSGCGGSNTPGPPPIFFAPGLYNLSGASASNPGVTSFRLAGSLIVTGTTKVSGVMHITMPCFSFATDIPVSGTLTADSVELTLSLPDGQQLSLSMNHPFGHTGFLTGSYPLAGAGCAPPDQGTVGGSVIAINGVWKGSFVPSTGAVSQITLTPTQTGPDAHGFFSFTGTATITGGTCFAAATVDASSTVFIGLGSTVTLDNSAPGTTGKTVITGDFTGPGIIGAYFFNGTYTSSQGACSETGTMAMQNGF
jgi:hypothetical protein